MLTKLRLIQRAHRYKRRHDPAEIAEMLRRIPTGGTVIDIGAHKGAYSYWMGKAVGPKGRLIAIEPQPELAERLKEHYKSNPRVRVRHSAVSDTTGSITLHIPDAGPSHGATIRRLDPGETVRAIEVPSIAFSDLPSEFALRRIDFIKCDCEGAERVIFGSGKEVLEKFKPTVLVECEKRHAESDSDPVGELWAIFQSLGYTGQCFVGGKLIDIKDFDYNTHQHDPDDKPNYGNNFLFVHPQKSSMLGR